MLDENRAIEELVFKNTLEPMASSSTTSIDSDITIVFVYSICLLDVDKTIG